MKCGLLGEKLSHSYSPQIHSLLGDYDYQLYEKAPEELKDFLTHGDFGGLNVTIPYKKAVLPYCAELTPRAKALGCVNTIVRRSDGSLLGHNSDYFGFETMVKHSGLQVAEKKVLVLGSGGASNTAVAVLEALGAKVVIISRTGENHYGNLHLHKDAAVIVNTTPVGMFPHTGVSPIDIRLFPQLQGVLDVIYNPCRTQLLLDAEEQGLVTCNGLLMLVAQAAESAQWFTGRAIDRQRISHIHRIMKNQMENIVLIGMPGSGKTTVGEYLAQKTRRSLVDADAEIVKLAGISIPDIFAQRGEEGFRALETAVLAELGKRSGIILSTGGGCVTRQENYPLLHQNGRIFCIERDLDQLATEGRPLSQRTKLTEMYALRRLLYRQFADHEISNNGTPESTANAILNLWEACL